jgi:hypothetical protein
MSNKVPLANALHQMTQLMDIIDEGGELDKFIQESFDVVRGDFTSAVSRRVCLIQSIPGLIQRCKEMRDEWTKKGKSLAAIEQKIKEHTMMLMSAHPELAFKCDMGEFRIQKNGVPSLETSLNLRTVSVQNVLDNADVDKLPKEFVDVRSYYTLVTEKLKEELMKGAEFSWASLNFGQSLRIRK